MPLSCQHSLSGASDLPSWRCHIYHTVRHHPNSAVHHAALLLCCVLQKGNGFFINTALTMLSVQASLWAYLLLALDKSSNPEVQKYLSAVQVLQLGTLSVGVYLFTLTLEMGLLSSLFTIVRQVLQGEACSAAGVCHQWWPQP